MINELAEKCVCAFLASHVEQKINIATLLCKPIAFRGGFCDPLTTERQWIHWLET